MYRNMCSTCAGCVSPPCIRINIEDTSNVNTTPRIGLMIRFSLDASLIFSIAMKTISIIMLMKSMQMVNCAFIFKDSAS